MSRRGIIKDRQQIEGSRGRRWIYLEEFDHATTGDIGDPPQNEMGIRRPI